MENIMKYIFPPKCFFCPNIGDYICKDCLMECELLCSLKCIVCDQISITGETHNNCKTNLTPITQFSIFNYNHYVRETIKISKYQSLQFCAIKKLSEYGIKEVVDRGLKINKSFIAVPIPLSLSKIEKRGFNQSYLIAKIFSKHLGIGVDNNILERTKDTKAQFTNSRVNRFENLRGAFRVKKVLNGKKILLIDDICTSGATLLEASKCLYEAGASEVHCFTLAKSELAPASQPKNHTNYFAKHEKNTNIASNG